MVILTNKDKKMNQKEAVHNLTETIGSLFLNSLYDEEGRIDFNENVEAPVNCTRFEQALDLALLWDYLADGKIDQATEFVNSLERDSFKHLPTSVRDLLDI